MSLHISKYPSTLCAAKNPDVFVIQSDIQLSPVISPVTIGLFWITEPQEGTVSFTTVDDHSFYLFVIGGSGDSIPTKRIGQSWTDWLTIALAFILDRLNQTYYGWTGNDAHWTGSFDAGAQQIIITGPYSPNAVYQVQNIHFLSAMGLSLSWNNGAPSTGTMKLLPSFIFELWNNAMIFRDEISPVYDTSNLTATIDVSELLMGSIPRYNFFDSPPTVELPMPRSEVVFPFYIKFSESYQGFEGTPGVIMSNWFYALNGGVPPWKHVDFYKAYQTFEQYFIDTKRTFLTWHYFEKTVALNDIQTVFFLNMADRGDATIYLVFAPVFSLTSVEPFTVAMTLDMFKAYQVLEFNVSPANAFPDADGNRGDLLSYSVWIKQHNSPITEKLYFKIDYRQMPDVSNFLFLNSLGAYESVRLTGPESTEDTYVRDLFDQTALAPYNSFARSKGQVSPVLTSVKTVNTGWISKEEAEWMRDFIYSQEVYEIIDGKYYPVLITQDKEIVNHDDSFLYCLSITVESIDLKNVYQGIIGTMPTTTTLIAPY